MNKIKMSKRLRCYSSVKYGSGFSNISQYNAETTHTHQPTNQPANQPTNKMKISNKTWKFYNFLLHFLEFSKLKESYSMNVKIVTETCKCIIFGAPVSLLELLDGI